MVNKENRNNILAAIATALVTIFLTSFLLDWNKIDDAVTQEVLKTEIEKSSEDVLQRSRRYTDDRVDGVNAYYESNFKHLEKIINANNEKFEMILKSIDDRLDRIDQRIEN
jgi:membrane-associated HD superfamily phosphohydrolase